MKTLLDLQLPIHEITIYYLFEFPDGTSKEFEVMLDKETLQIVHNKQYPKPDWARLEAFKCPHCPLSDFVCTYCPLAINLAGIIPQFQEMPSYREAKVTVRTSARDYSKETSLQSGVSSLLGILMVSSGCPIMGKLKPMLHFHLPFGTLDETQVRVLSLYALAQYVKWKRGGHPDWEMNDLVGIYEDIRQLNRNVSKKIANLEIMDTSINSIVILNNFAEYVTLTIDEKMLDELEFYLKEFMG
ncbi:MAG: hypothetical protein LWX56_08840 [Ignavibacteria bacterium]|nr:hypothetical protein [Ignavibacteria bacterium]